MDLNGSNNADKLDSKNKKRKLLPLELINEIYANLPVPKQCELLALNRRIFEMRNGPVKRNLKNWKREFAKFTRTYFGDEEYERMLEYVEVKLSTHDVLGTECVNLQVRQQLLINKIDQNIEWVRQHFRMQGRGDNKEFEERLKERNFDLSVQIKYLSSRIHEEGCFLKMWENLQRKYAAEGQNNGSNNINSFHRQLMKLFQKRRLIFRECQEMMPFVDVKMDEWKRAIGK